MVGTPTRPDSTNDQRQVSQNPPIQILSDNHNIDPAIIRSLIQTALNPLPVEPIPSRVVISNIVIRAIKRSMDLYVFLCFSDEISSIPVDLF